MTLAALLEPLAIVPRCRRRTRLAHCPQDWSSNNGGGQQQDSNNINTTGAEDRFGDSITKKGNNILRIGFQNIGGLPTHAGMIKDEILRRGISKYDFDIFGLAETNVDWRALSEEDKLYFRT